MSTRLFVGNLSFYATEASISEAFAQDSRKVSSVSVVTDRETGQSRGFAFVEMASSTDAQAAIQALDGSLLDGRAIRVSEAQDRKPRGDSRDRGREAW